VLGAEISRLLTAPVPDRGQNVDTVASNETGPPARLRATADSHWPGSRMAGRASYITDAVPVGWRWNVNMDRVLLIDDDAGLIHEQVRQAFPRPGYDVQLADTGSAGIANVRARAPDVILLDLRLPDRSGLAVFEAIREIDARIPVIFVTTAKTSDTAIEAMKHGAFDYLHKPLDLEQLQRVVDDALDVARRMRAPVRLADAASPQVECDVDGAIFGSDPRMLQIYKSIGRVAAQDVTVLITGESGTGKELVARAIYQHGARAKEPFFALNCAAIPENLIESELFGHEKGAFTGADRRRIGKFEQYSGGTILLDEIGDMPLQLQAKILRLLQEQTFERVGGTETLHSNVRILASTHRDLRAWAAEEKFRSDLYYRLSVFSIHLPPLRDRATDLEQLVRHYVARFAQALHRDIREIAPETLERLRAYTWPGNIRELQSVIKQALLRASGTVLLPAFLPDLHMAASRGAKEPPATAGALPDLDAYIRDLMTHDTDDVYAETHRHVDRLLLVRALEHTGGNQRDASRRLGISRQTMRTRLRSLGLTVNMALEIEDEGA
jgi:two-component system nitrogen regulation response regulator GlnG